MALGGVLAWFRSLNTRPEPKQENQASFTPPPRRPRPERVTIAALLHQLRRRHERLSVATCVYLGLELCRQHANEQGPMPRLTGAELNSVFLTEELTLAAVNCARGLDALSPEEVQGRALDERTDVFAIGLFVFEALHGQRAYRADSDLERLQHAMNVALPELGRDDVPKELRDVLAQALEPKPELRFATVLELRAAMEPFAHSTGRAQLERFAPPGRERLTPAEPATTNEADVLARIAAGDDEARLVFADMLEEAGRSLEALWLREELSLRKLEGHAQLNAIARLRALPVSEAFVTSVARSPIEACGVSFGFVCPRKWNALQPTEQPSVRFCTACEEPVHFVTSLDQAHAYAAEGRCIAVAPSVVRSPNDLDGPQHATLGRGVAPHGKKRRKASEQ